MHGPDVELDSRVAALVAVVAAVDVGLVGSYLAVATRLPQSRADPVADIASGVAVVAIGVLVSCSVVLRVPRNPVGWILLAASSMAALDCLATVMPAMLDARGVGNAASIVVGVEGPLWLAYLGLLGFAFLLLPDGRYLSHRWRRFAWVLGAALALTYAVMLVVPDASYGPTQSGIPNGTTLAALDNTGAHIVRIGCAVSVQVMLAVAALSIGIRYRRGTRDTRRQLTWVAMAAALVPVFVLTVMAAHVFLGARTADGVTTIALVVLLLAVSTGMALAVTRYRLYSVNAVVDSTLSWLGASIFVLVVAAAVVVGAGLLAGSAASRSPIVVAGATALALVAVRPVREGVQRLVNRTFHRRAYDAARIVSAYAEKVQRGAATLDDLDEVFAWAVGDPALSVHFVPGRNDDSGHLVTEVRSDGDPGVVESAVAAGTLLLDNARLQAQVLAQLADVRASRQRIVEATLAERRRLERDLHDGAQSRLVAAALAISRTEHSDGGERAELTRIAVGLVNETIRDVRAIARGLHPSALNEEGLQTAIEYLADRLPIAAHLELDVPNDLNDAVAACGYFAVSEALSNVMKHADASEVEVTGRIVGSRLRLCVTDDGSGTATVTSEGGLAGLGDRIEALGGSLVVTSRSGRGTSVEVDLPCVL